MIDFLKSFFAGEQKAVPSGTHDVLRIENYAMEDEEEAGNCCSPCGGCGCRG